MVPVVLAGAWRSWPASTSDAAFSPVLLLFAGDFLAKYCIIGPEALAEYRRVFEEVRERTVGAGMTGTMAVASVGVAVRRPTVTATAASPALRRCWL